MKKKFTQPEIKIKGFKDAKIRMAAEPNTSAITYVMGQIRDTYNANASARVKWSTLGGVIEFKQ
ncbi:MAG: hypothetical protein PUD92_08600 [Clostridiales bacterium]|nr:hypothetical protein [Clostridiales bacterium]